MTWHALHSPFSFASFSFTVCSFAQYLIVAVHHPLFSDGRQGGSHKWSQSGDALCSSSIYSLPFLLVPPCSLCSLASLFDLLNLLLSANDVASSGKRSTIQGKDVLKAIEEIDFGSWRPTLEKLLAGSALYLSYPASRRCKCSMSSAYYCHVSFNPCVSLTMCRA